MSNHLHQGGEQYQLTLEAAPSDEAPPVIRLRSALKVLLRAFGLRCREVRDVTPRPPPLPATTPAAPGGPTETPGVLPAAPGGSAGEGGHEHDGADGTDQD